MRGHPVDNMPTQITKAQELVYELKIEQVMTRNVITCTPDCKMQELKGYNGAIEEHIERVLQDFSQVSNLRVVVDCGCGAASLVTPHLLRRLGCKVLAINSYPSVFFPRPMEPTAENLDELSRVVKTIRADLGIAHDGDADRPTASAISSG